MKQIINQIRIENILSHKKTILNLHENVNAITGISGSGKSSIYLAIDWLYRNKPLGEDIFSWHGGNPMIELTLSEGIKIGRKRTKKENYYFINDKKIEGSGKGSPPQEILDVLNFSDINFERQKSSAFLIDPQIYSSGEVARRLNEAVNLQIIDVSIANIASILRKEKSDLNIVEAAKSQNKEKLKKFDWLESAEKELIQLEQIEDEINQLTKQQESLNHIVERIQENNVSLEQISKILQVNDEIQNLETTYQNIQDLKCQKENLSNLTNQVINNTYKLQNLENITKALPEIKSLIKLDEELNQLDSQAEEIETIIKRVEQNKTALNQLNGKITALAEINNLIATHNEIDAQYLEYNSLVRVVANIETKNEELNQINIQIDKIQNKLKEITPDTCPLCGK